MNHIHVFLTARGEPCDMRKGQFPRLRLLGAARHTQNVIRTVATSGGSPINSGTACIPHQSKKRLLATQPTYPLAPTYPDPHKSPGKGFQPTNKSPAAICEALAQLRGHKRAWTLYTQTYGQSPRLFHKSGKYY